MQEDKEKIEEEEEYFDFGEESQVDEEVDVEGILEDYKFEGQRIELDDGNKVHLVEGITHGGMGQIYKGRQEIDGRKKLVAVKWLPYELIAGDASLLRMFNHEGKGLLGVRNLGERLVKDWSRQDPETQRVMRGKKGFEKIIKVYNRGFHEVGKPEDENYERHAYYNMDFKQDSLEMLVKQGYLTIKNKNDRDPDALRVIIPIAEELHILHEKGIIHRDIKPPNIIGESIDDSVLTDFGLVKSTKKAKGTLKLSTVTKKGQRIMKGTPMYMSPEQAEGLATDRLTDIYSLGMTLYEYVTGKKPYTAKSDEGIIDKVQDTVLDPAWPRDVNPNIHPELEKIILKAIAKEKEERYQTLRDFYEDLYRYQRGEKVHAEISKVRKDRHYRELHDGLTKGGVLWRRIKIGSLPVLVAAGTIAFMFKYGIKNEIDDIKDKLKDAVKAEKNLAEGKTLDDSLKFFTESYQYVNEAETKLDSLSTGEKAEKFAKKIPELRVKINDKKNDLEWKLTQNYVSKIDKTDKTDPKLVQYLGKYADFSLESKIDWLRTSEIKPGDFPYSGNKENKYKIVDLLEDPFGAVWHAILKMSGKGWEKDWPLDKFYEEIGKTNTNGDVSWAMYVNDIKDGVFIGNKKNLRIAANNLLERFEATGGNFIQHYYPVGHEKKNTLYTESLLDAIILITAFEEFGEQIYLNAMNKHVDFFMKHMFQKEGGVFRSVEFNKKYTKAVKKIGWGYRESNNSVVSNMVLFSLEALNYLHKKTGDERFSEKSNELSDFLIENMKNGMLDNSIRVSGKKYTSGTSTAGLASVLDIENKKYLEKAKEILKDFVVKETINDKSTQNIVKHGCFGPPAGHERGYILGDFYLLRAINRLRKKDKQQRFYEVLRKDISEKVFTTSGFKKEKTGLVELENPTIVEATYDEENIYFKFTCKEEKPISYMKGRDGSLLNGSSIEMYIDTDEGLLSFGVDCEGNRYDSKKLLPKLFNSEEWKSKVYKKEKEWIAEFTIPFKLIKKKSKHHVNFLRNFKGQTSSYEPVEINPHKKSVLLRYDKPSLGELRLK